MKRIGLAWRVAIWLLFIGWILVIIEELLDSLFHLSQRDHNVGLLVIPYLEFVQRDECHGAIVWSDKRSDPNARLQAKTSADA